MVTKVDLIKQIVEEFQVGQPATDRDVGPWFRPCLWIGDGRGFEVTQKLLNLIDEYVSICVENTTHKSQVQTLEESTSTYRRAFAIAFSEIDIDSEIPGLEENFENIVCNHVVDSTRHFSKASNLTVGCQLFTAASVYPIKMGPVLFEHREQWLTRMCHEQKLSAITQRRIEAAWAGKKRRKRKGGADTVSEQGVVLSTIDWPVVCTITAKGLSQGQSRTHGLLAARLAMTTLSLIGERPSRLLEWMRTADQGQSFSYSYIQSRSDGPLLQGNRRKGFPVGYGYEDQVTSTLPKFQWLFDLVGDALSFHLNPSQVNARPKVMRWIFLSLWWMHDACREPSDQMATVKFGACLDTMSCGGRVRGIRNLVKAQLGWSGDRNLTHDGRTVSQMIDEIYTDGRSKFSHGTNQDYLHDWSIRLHVAELLARKCLVNSLLHLSENTEIVDPKVLTKMPTK